jgi:fucose permease
VSPLIGFLPARTKARLELTHGVDPVATTFQSVFVEFLITLGAFAMSAIGKMIEALEGHNAGISSKLFVGIAIVVGLDAAMRYDRILREERPPPGFYEWLVTRRPPLG